MRQGLLILALVVGAGALGAWQNGPAARQAAGADEPPCKPLTYFGVTGCVPDERGECLRGYHKQAACPTNPMIKAPCRLLCVADKNADEPKQKPKG